MTPAVVAAVLLGPLAVYVIGGAVRDAIRDRVIARRDLEHAERMAAIGRAVWFEPADGEAVDQ